jgi:hypothetical protein
MASNPAVAAGIGMVGGLIGSMIGCFLLGVLYEGLKFFREFMLRQEYR